MDQNLTSSSRTFQPNYSPRASRGVICGAQTSGAAAWRSALGPESRLPNVYWGALSPGSLRRMSCFTALPPLQQVFLGGEATYRYVRQDTALWTALHAGRLTTSRLKDALGLRDRTASRMVGGPQYPQLGVLQAFTHLLQPPFTPPKSSLAMAAAEAGCTEDSTTILQLNESTRLQYNLAMAEAAAAAGATMPAEEAGSGADVRSRAPGRKLPSKERGGNGRRHEGGDEWGEKPHTDDGWSRDDRRRMSELAALAVGAAGAVRMRLLWGSLQEASAVATLAVLFPTSQLEEVGLLCLPDPTPWGVQPGDLPPIGASPDALITHHVPITRGDISAARAQLATTARTYQGTGDATSTELREAARRTARSILRSALVRHTQLPAGLVSTSSTSSGSSSCISVGNSGSGAITASHPPSSDPPPPLFASGWEEVLEWLAAQLLSREDRDLAVIRPRQQPPASSSSFSSSSSYPPSLSTLDSGLERHSKQQQKHRQQQSQTEMRGLITRRSEDGNDDSEVVATLPLREVVEVKNHCPFVFKGQRKARKRGLVIDYVVRDRGPIESVWPLWMPQLQAHIACSGTDSALLLSRSPSKGVRLFRVFRDDSYIEKAFSIVRELQFSHVARKEPPGSDPWAGRAGYEDFVQHTVALAHGAKTVILTPLTPELPGTDKTAFWRLM